MYKNGAYYNGIGPWLKERFGMRVSKVSIDGGFTCPNRDGTLGTGGCIFCSETGSGDFAGTRIREKKEPDTSPTESGNTAFIRIPEKTEHGASSAITEELAAILKTERTEIRKPDKFSHTGCRTGLRSVPSVTEQINAQIDALRGKWKDFRCIAYFQNFTNTYAPLNVLREKYEEALSHPDCVGLAIATRPDCIGDDILDYLTELSRRTFLWVELGLQTSDETTAALIRRGYPYPVYKDAVSRLSERGIPVVTHLIAGLPGENRESFLRSVQDAVSGNIFGIKLQLLHIVKNTYLADRWKEQQPLSEKGILSENVLSSSADSGQMHPFPFPEIRPLEKEEYISMIADALEIIPPEVTIHRLTGDAPRDTLLAPHWSRDKKSVLNGINMELKKRSSCQGSAK